MALPSRRLLAFVPRSSRDAVEQAAGALNLEPVTSEGLSSFLEELRTASALATVLSLSDDAVDEEVARRVSETPGCGTLLLSGPAVSLERALTMERVGAVAFLREPLDAETLRQRLEAVAEEGPEVRLPEPPDEDGPEMVGTSPVMAHVFETVARVAPTDSTVLVTGESGTGKEVVARILHGASARAEGPFVAINCAAIPEHLLESELFGHERGAFTGAVERRTGRFQRARGGTLFLDEIGDMSPVLQSKILRVLEERVVEPVGGSEAVPVDARIVAATNQSLADRMADGDFREDLYFRLAVVELHLPPLRERGGDIRTLALHFAARFADRDGRPVTAVTEEALRRLEHHAWPGNVRELRNVMDRAVILCPGSTLRSASLRLGAGSPRGSARPGTGPGGGYPPTLSLEEVEADHIRRVLAAVDGHMSRAADVLGVHRNTLTRKVRDYGIDPDAGSGGPR